jgi:hypothetical protein
MNEEMWLVTAMANRDQSQPICGVNQELKIHHDGRSECVFSVTSDPTPASDNLMLLSILAAALLVGILILAIIFAIPLFSKTTWSDFTW